ncbi:hypothetical protein EMCRGX_G019863 [Ephydatia muelleri]
MSSVYINEPATHGKVLLKTSLGDIDVELWSKECPMTCRNFVQLCMERYYNGTIFHRIVAEFVAQGGDPTGTGEGGESIYGEPFKDEFHQRLRYNRRGLVGMASAAPNDNASQFFFTLGRADELTGKNTLFGKITGDTLYNLVQFNDIPTDKDGRPMHPPKIIKTEVLLNPFDDIVPRLTKEQEALNLKKASREKRETKAVKNFSLLSFGEEAEEEEEEESTSKGLKIKSSHDVLEDPKLSSQVTPVEGAGLRGSDQSEQITDNAKALQCCDQVGVAECDQVGVAECDQVGVAECDQVGVAECDQDDPLISDAEFDAKMRASVKEKLNIVEEFESEEQRSLKRRDELRKQADQLKKEIREAKKQRERELLDGNADEEGIPEAVKALRKEQQLYRMKKEAQLAKGEGREEQTLEMLARFRARLVSVREKGPVTSADPSSGVPMTTGPITELINNPSKTTNPSTVTVVEENAPDATATNPSGDQSGPAAESSDANNDDEYEWLGCQLRFDEERLIVAKDANRQNEDTYHIYDPRNPLNKRRRGEGVEQEGSSKKKGRQA